MPPLLLRESVDRPAFDAIVLADSRASDARVLGLRASERARRVAERVGAGRILVLSGPDAADARAWWGEAAAGTWLLVIDSRGQLTHPPLVEPLLDASADRVLAVAPDGAPAGALLAAPAEAGAVAANPAQALEQWAADPGVATVPHGAVARHPTRNRTERRAAARYLEQIVHKAQDGPVTRWLYRPVSLPITRLLVWTPITPNQISLIVAVLGAIGIYFTAHYDYDSVVIGSVLVLIAAYVDGCDGEVARLKLRSSKLGAWIDTITDEATTVAYMIALGIHNYQRHPEPWVAGTIALGAACYLTTIYAIYYYLIVVHGSANSQDYVDVLEIVPGNEPGTRALRPVETEALTGVWAFLPHLARRDFINWGALLFAALHLTYLSYGLMVLGGLPAVVKTMRDHLRLRGQLRELRS